MKVLVTGATGFLGRIVVSSLISRNISVAVLTRNSPVAVRDSPNTLEYKAHNPAYIEFDLLGGGNYRDLLHRIQPTHLVHIAWYTDVNKYWESPLNKRWLEESVALIRAFCELGGKHITVAGSCAEYGSPKSICIEDITPVAPHSVYGCAKNNLRRSALEICTANEATLCWCRIFFPYGIGEPKEKLIPSLIAAFRKEIPPFGVAKDSVRDFIFIDDAGHAIASLVAATTNGVFNISTGIPFVIGELVELTASILNADPELILHHQPPAKQQAAMLLGNNEKLKRLGWQPNISLAQGLGSLCRVAAEVDNR